jgi:hypothetical protein
MIDGSKAPKKMEHTRVEDAVRNFISKLNQSKKKPFYPKRTPVLYIDLLLYFFVGHLSLSPRKLLPIP